MEHGEEEEISCDVDGRRLRKQTSKGKISVRKLKQSILLAIDHGEIDADIAAVLGIAVTTVERIRRRFVEGGVEFAFWRRPRAGGNRTGWGRRGAAGGVGVQRPTQRTQHLDNAVAGRPLSGTGSMDSLLR